MANVVREPGEHPEVVVPDLSVADPLVTFTASDRPSQNATEGNHYD